MPTRPPKRQHAAERSACLGSETFHFGPGFHGLFRVLSGQAGRPERAAEGLVPQHLRAPVESLRRRAAAQFESPPSPRAFRYLRSLSDLWTPFGRFLTHLGDRACPWMHRMRGITGTRCPTAALHPSPVDRRGGGQNRRPAASRAGVSGPGPRRAHYDVAPFARWSRTCRYGDHRAAGCHRRTGPVRLLVRCEPARSQRGRTLTLPVGRRNRRPSASSRVPGGIAIADITRRQTAELLQKSFKILIT